MNLITLGDIYAITGLSDEALTSLIPYAQSQAEAVLGFLEKETKTKEFYIWDTMDTFHLEDRPINSISSVKYKATAAADEQTADTDEYRAVLSEGLLIFDYFLPENYTLTVEYDVGWDQTTVTSLVKTYLSVLVVNHYYSLYPEISVPSPTIISKKIGDVTLKYANVDPKAVKTLDQWCDYLATLIKSGGMIPGSY